MALFALVFPMVFVIIISIALDFTSEGDFYIVIGITGVIFVPISIILLFMKIKKLKSFYLACMEKNQS